MAKLSPIVLHGYTLDRATAVILLECWRFSKRETYTGGILVPAIDGLILRRLALALPIHEFIRDWTPRLTCERNRWQSVELLVKAGLLRKATAYADNDYNQRKPLYYGVAMTDIGTGLAQDLPPLLPNRLDSNVFRRLSDLISCYSKRKGKPDRHKYLIQIEQLKNKAIAEAFA